MKRHDCCSSIKMMHFICTHLFKLSYPLHPSRFQTSDREFVWGKKNTICVSRFACRMFEWACKGTGLSSQKHLRNVHCASKQTSLILITHQTDQTQQNRHTLLHTSHLNTTPQWRRPSPQWSSCPVCGGYLTRNWWKTHLGTIKILWYLGSTSMPDKTWAQAQEFCREPYTDLLSISSEWEENRVHLNSPNLFPLKF